MQSFKNQDRNSSSAHFSGSQNVKSVSLRLNGQVVCSCSAAGAAGLAESTLVFLTVSAAGAKQKPVGASILDLRTADLPAAGTVATVVIPQIGVVLDLTGFGLLPSV